MQVVLKQVMNQAKNGYLVKSPELRIAAYGSTLDLATRNLERLALLYLRPFEREGSLETELSVAGLQTEPNDQGLSVRLAE
jgi:hypothetical protein